MTDNGAAVAITGMGAVSALGAGVEAQVEALRATRSCLGPARWSDAALAGSFGGVPMGDAELLERTGGTANASRTGLLAMLAAQEAIGGVKDAIDIVISASTVGGMNRTEAAYATRASDPAHFADAVREHEVGRHAQAIAARIGARQVATISTACSSSANAIMFGAQLIAAGKARRVLVGGADALCRFTIVGFRALSAMDPSPCRPFSADRAGMNLGEGAAYLVLEPLADAQRAGRVPLAILAGFGHANDAHHATATSPQGNGPYRAMREALAHAAITPEEVDHINAHGTATENNDLTELIAMERLFAVMPPFTATKSLTGHVLAAAGALEAVFSVIAIDRGFLPATARVGASIEGHAHQPIAQRVDAAPRTVLSSSFGFGGNCSALLFRKP